MLIQILMDARAAWSPDGIDGRFYDYKTLIDLADFAVVMSYGECVVRASARGVSA